MKGFGNIYDVAIVGGGPAGTCAAIHLAAGGARVRRVYLAGMPHTL
jgi:2-polyprenyl-6-methoxyphenol hydroxylase-like FAD-dependent oxidoreductase